MKKILALTFFVLSSQSAMASGLDLTLAYGTRYIGLGGNQVALVEDAYSPFYNPAGLMGLERGSFALNSANLLMQYEAPIGGANQQLKSDLNWGSLFYAGGGYRLTDRVAIGLGVYPTALQGGKFSNVTYGGDLGEHDLGNRLVRIEFAPSVAVKLIDYLSLGMSFRAGYTRFENYGGVFGSVPIYSSFKVSGWDAKGFKIGAKLHEFHGFSAALTWRFKTTTTLEGGYSQEIAGTGQVTETPAQFKVKIPAQLQAGIAYEFIPDTALLAFAYEFTQNDIVNDITITNPDAENAVISSLPLDWENGHTFHLGGEYTFHLSNDRRLRTQLGLALDRRVTQKNYPVPATPPADHYLGYALGAQYEWSRHIAGLALNYGQYSHRSSSVDSNASVQAAVTPDSEIIFPGKYALKVLYIVADYQIHF